MNEEHISSAFDRDLETVQALIMKMGGLVEEAILNSAISLEKRDEELAEKVRRGDRTIDELELKIDEETARIIALRAPTAVDLRVILTVMKMASNLERIGDYAKNIAKRTTVLSQLTQIDGSSAALRRMARETERMLRDALDAYIQRDAALAREVMERDTDVDQMYNALFREFLTHMMEDPRNITACTHLLFSAKNIERIGDHATNIAETIYYIRTGHEMTSERVKSDNTTSVTHATIENANGGTI